MKTETGDTRIFGVMVGIVAKNYDDKMPGRICVTIPVRDKDANEMKWVKVVSPSGGKKWGHYFLPEVGDQVLLAFEQGNLEKPYMIGCVHKDNDTFLNEVTDKDNQFKRIQTKYGNAVIFEDNKEGEGEKDKITIETPKSAHQMILDNENKKICISDKEKKTMVELLSEDGAINIKASNSLVIQVVDTIKISMDGGSGQIKVKANKLSIEASEGINEKTDGNYKVNGAQVAVEAASQLKLSSSGMVKVEGTPIKIG